MGQFKVRNSVVVGCAEVEGKLESFRGIHGVHERKILDERSEIGGGAQKEEHQTDSHLLEIPVSSPKGPKNQKQEEPFNSGEKIKKRRQPKEEPSPENSFLKESREGKEIKKFPQIGRLDNRAIEGLLRESV